MAKKSTAIPTRDQIGPAISALISTLTPDEAVAYDAIMTLGDNDPFEIVRLVKRASEGSCAQDERVGDSFEMDSLDGGGSRIVAKIGATEGKYRGRCVRLTGRGVITVPEFYRRRPRRVRMIGIYPDLADGLLIDMLYASNQINTYIGSSTYTGWDGAIVDIVVSIQDPRLREASILHDGRARSMLGFYPESVDHTHLALASSAGYKLIVPTGFEYYGRHVVGHDVLGNEVSASLDRAIPLNVIKPSPLWTHPGKTTAAEK